jgi:hypothetical protein
MFARTSRLAALLLPLALAACGGTADLAEVPEPLGTFRLGHNIVVSKNAAKLPLSRPASAEELKTSLTEAIDARLGRYTGEKMFHVGVNVDGYLLAVPGIPVVASPKSAMIISVNVWDDAKNLKLTERAHQITVLEQISPETLVSSGLTQSREQQLQNLSENAARAIETYLKRNPEWFEPAQEPAVPVAELSGTGAAAAFAATGPAPAGGAINSEPVPAPTSN